MSRYSQQLPNFAGSWTIDLCPDGGEYGGRIVAAGTPVQVCRSKKSYTAEALRKVPGGGTAAA